MISELIVESKASLYSRDLTICFPKLVKFDVIYMRVWCHGDGVNELIYCVQGRSLCFSIMAKCVQTSGIDMLYTGAMTRVKELSVLYDYQ